jgi:hypothetical protein
MVLSSFLRVGVAELIEVEDTDVGGISGDAGGVSTRSTGVPKAGVWWIIGCRDLYETVLDKGCLLEAVELADVEDTGAEDFSGDAGGVSTRVKFTEEGSKDR